MPEYSDIWSNDTPRSTCMQAEPLAITKETYGDLVDIGSSVWKAVDGLVGRVMLDGYFKNTRNLVELFPEGATMPPAIRVDCVLTEEGPRVVEIDPATALSLGETQLLSDIWRSRGYQVIDGLAEEIAASIGGLMLVDLPAGKMDYYSDTRYIVVRVNDIKESSVPSPDKMVNTELSAFMEDPQRRKNVNSRRLTYGKNPLWGSLWPLSDKELMANTGLMEYYLGDFCVRQSTFVNFGEIFGGDDLVVIKPAKSMGSAGIKTAFAKDIDPEKGFVYQELLQPKADSFNGQEYATRLSIYAARTGICGAQVTALPITSGFNNVHGQPKAVQTCLSLI